MTDTEILLRDLAFSIRSVWILWIYTTLLFWLKLTVVIISNSGHFSEKFVISPLYMFPLLHQMVNRQG